MRIGRQGEMNTNGIFKEFRPTRQEALTYRSSEMHGQQERLLGGLVIANVAIERTDGHLTNEGCARVARSQGIATVRIGGSLPGLKGEPCVWSRGGLGRRCVVSRGGALGIPQGVECRPIVVGCRRFSVATVQRDWLVAKVRKLVDELSLLQGYVDAVALHQVSHTGLIHSLDGQYGFKLRHSVLIIVDGILDDGFAGIGATVVPVTFT